MTVQQLDILRGKFLGSQILRFGDITGPKNMFFYEVTLRIVSDSTHPNHWST